MSQKRRTNHTFFMDDEIQQLSEFYSELVKSNGLEMVKAHAIANYINNAKRPEYDLTTESWLIAVLSFLDQNNFEVKKKEQK